MQKIDKKFEIEMSENIKTLHELQIILNLGDDASENAKQKMQSFISKK